MSVQNHDRQESHVNQEQTAHNELGTSAVGPSGTEINTRNETTVVQQQSQVERPASTVADDTRPPSMASTGQVCR